MTSSSFSVRIPVDVLELIFHYDDPAHLVAQASRVNKLWSTLLHINGHHHHHRRCEDREGAMYGSLQAEKFWKRLCHHVVGHARQSIAGSSAEVGNSGPFQAASPLQRLPLASSPPQTLLAAIPTHQHNVFNDDDELAILNGISNGGDGGGSSPVEESDSTNTTSSSSSPTRKKPRSMCCSITSYQHYCAYFLRRCELSSSVPGVKVSRNRLSVRAVSPVFGWRTFLMLDNPIDYFDQDQRDGDEATLGLGSSSNNKDHRYHLGGCTKIYHEFIIQMSDDVRLCAGGRAAVGVAQVEAGEYNEYKHGKMKKAVQCSVDNVDAGKLLVSSDFGQNKEECVSMSNNNVIPSALPNLPPKPLKGPFHSLESEKLSCAYSSCNGTLSLGTQVRRYGPTYTHHDRIGLLIDLASGVVSFFKNDQWLGEAFRLGDRVEPPRENGEEDASTTALHDDHPQGPNPTPGVNGGASHSSASYVYIPGVSLCFAGATLLPTLEHPEPVPPKKNVND